MTTYTTLKGDVIDLTDLTGEEWSFLKRALAAWRCKAGYSAYHALMHGPENPLLRATGGWITKDVWDQPLFRALRDLDHRIGLRDEFYAPEPDVDIDAEPLCDEWVGLSEAAQRKGVSRSSINDAIHRGELVARARPGGTFRVISGASLARWQPNPVRRAAGQARYARATG